MLNFEVSKRSYSIEIDPESFNALLDSESYETNDAAFQPGNQTLSEKLRNISGVSGVHYDGHYENYVYLDIDVEDDTEELRADLSNIIENHLKWCKSLTSDSGPKP